jgi:hypothetical protein
MRFPRLCSEVTLPVINYRRCMTTLLRNVLSWKYRWVKGAVCVNIFMGKITAKVLLVLQIQLHAYIFPTHWMTLMTHRRHQYMCSEFFQPICHMVHMSYFNGEIPAWPVSNKLFWILSARKHWTWEYQFFGSPAGSLCDHMASDVRLQGTFCICWSYWPETLYICTTR